MTKIDDKIYRLIKRYISGYIPTKADIAKFKRKRELLDALEAEEHVYFRVEVKGFGDMKGSEPWNEPEFSQEGIGDLDKLKIRYTGNWYV